MKIKPIKTEQDYNEAIQGWRKFSMQKRGQMTGDELEILGILIENYENEFFPIDLPDPIEAIKFRMEQMNYSQNDLAEVIGLKSRASEILNKKRKLSLEMIRNLHDRLKIPTEVLIQAY